MSLSSDKNGKLLGSISLGDVEFAKLSMGFNRTVRAILKEHKLDYSYLAERLGKSENEINRWLSGMHNLTLRDMAKINAALPTSAIAFTRSIKAVPSPEDNQGARVKWHHGVDQWMEDKLWTRVPEKYATPHFFWMLGLICGVTFSFILMWFIR